MYVCLVFMGGWQVGVLKIMVMRERDSETEKRLKIWVMVALIQCPAPATPNLNTIFPHHRPPTL